MTGTDEKDPHPSVTVAVVSYFSAEVLEGCLDSIQRQQGVSATPVVVDNGAPEGDTATRELCDGRSDVTYIESETNVGFGTAVNRAFERADSDYLCTLNPDARLLSGALAELVAALDDRGDAIAVPKIVLDTDHDTISTCGLWNHFGGVSVNQGYKLPADHPDWTEPRPLSGLSGAAFATTPSAWGRLGGFDEEMFMYKDDVSVSWACHAEGIPIRYVPEAVASHRYDGVVDGTKMGHIERGRMLLLAKYVPRDALAVLLPSLVLVELLVLMLAVVKGPRTVLAKVKSYRVLRSEDLRSIRKRNASRRDAFPQTLRQLKVALPWKELARTGRVPDGMVVSLMGAAINAVFRLNVWVYRTVSSEVVPQSR